MGRLVIHKHLFPFDNHRNKIKNLICVQLNQSTEVKRWEGFGMFYKPMMPLNKEGKKKEKKLWLLCCWKEERTKPKKTTETERKERKRKVK